MTRTGAARHIVPTVLLRPLHMLFTEPVVAAFSSYVAFNFALLYSFFPAFPYVFETEHGYDTETIGLTFLGLGVGVLAATGIIVAQNKLIYKKKLEHVRRESAGSITTIPPENRLYTGMVGGVMMALGLFLFAWTAENSVLWIAPVIGEALFGCGNLLAFMACSIYFMDFYGPHRAASAQGANALLRYSMAAIFPLFAVQIYQGLRTGWATSLLGFISAALALVSFMLFKFGSRLRSRSRIVYKC